eukprot:1665944-Rhodomonas_salina.1
MAVAMPTMAGHRPEECGLMLWASSLSFSHPRSATPQVASSSVDARCSCFAAVHGGSFAVGRGHAAVCGGNTAIGG